MTCVESLAVAGLGDKKDPELTAFWDKCEAGGLAKTGTLLYFHYPLTWNPFMSDHVISFRLLAKGPYKTLLTTRWLVPRTGFASASMGTVII